MASIEWQDIVAALGGTSALTVALNQGINLFFDRRKKRGEADDQLRLQLPQREREFTERVLKENERLNQQLKTIDEDYRKRLQECDSTNGVMQKELSRKQREVDELQRKLDSLEHEKEHLEHEFQEELQQAIQQERDKYELLANKVRNEAQRAYGLKRFRLKLTDEQLLQEGEPRDPMADPTLNPDTPGIRAVVNETHQANQVNHQNKANTS